MFRRYYSKTQEAKKDIFPAYSKFRDHSQTILTFFTVFGCVFAAGVFWKSNVAEMKALDEKHKGEMMALNEKTNGRIKVMEERMKSQAVITDERMKSQAVVTEERIKTAKEASKNESMERLFNLIKPSKS